jgi:AraC-like DNA-binding protein
MLSRPAHAALSPFVGRIWAAEEPGGSVHELVLPTGWAYLVLRLDDSPLRVSDALGGRVSTVRNGVIGGARASYYVRDLSRPARSVGAELLPGAARLLFGTPADALAEAHTALDSVWSTRDVESMRDQLASEPSAEARLARFERLLFARLPQVRAVHPAVAQALQQLGRCDVRAVVRDSGYSHRGFNNLFRAAVGLTPKLFVRVQRFAHALERVHGADEQSLALLACASGYSDQAHFNRDFRAFAGVSPGRYRALSPRFAHHLPLV